MAYLEVLASRQGGLSKGVPLYEEIRMHIGFTYYETEADLLLHFTMQFEYADVMVSLFFIFGIAERVDEHLIVEFHTDLSW